MIRKMNEIFRVIRKKNIKKKYNVDPYLEISDERTRSLNIRE